MSVNNSNDSCDVPACRAVPQPNAPPRTPHYNTISRFPATPKLNPDSKSKSQRSCLSESQYLLPSVPNLGSQRCEYHALPLSPSSRGVSDCWTCPSVVKNPSFLNHTFANNKLSTILRAYNMYKKTAGIHTYKIKNLVPIA
jgi:hypothetical protein